VSTIKIILKKDKINKSGEAPLYLRLIKDRKAKFISLGIRINPKDWNEEVSKVRKSHPNSQRMNHYIAQKIADAEGIALEMESKSKFISPKTIKQGIMGKSGDSFLKYFSRYVEKLKNREKIGTYNKVKTVFSKLSEFTKGNDLLFDELTVSFIKDYENYLSENLGNSQNTIHSNLKVIRRVINDAVSEDLFPLEKNPFLKMKLKAGTTKKEFLTEEEIKKIEDLMIPDNTMLFHHRNIYIFATYAGGIRISDLLQLKWKNYDGDRILIETKKTQNNVSIKLPMKAKEIIELYRTDKTIAEDYVFPFLKNETEYTPYSIYRAISSRTAYINKDLKKIAATAQIDKNIHFHTSRHTFATRALRKGMRIEYVSKLLGHESIKTTQVYAKIVNKDLDDAMDKYFE
jgi:site-specific recombinase XerD